MHHRLAVLILLGCHQSAISSATPATPNAISGDNKRATTIMKVQVASLVDNDGALVDTFAPDAVVLVPDARVARADTTGLREAITRLEPSAQLKGVAIVKLVAGADDGAVWWSAELAVKRADGKTVTVRATELATKDAGWKVVAGAFGELRKAGAPSEADDIPDKSATAAGPLSSLLAKPGNAPDALAPSAVVFGTDTGEAAWDSASAKKLLAGWSRLDFTVNGKVREVSGASWSFAIANVDWKQPNKKYLARMAGLVIADGSGHVVAVQYTAY